MQDFPPNRVQDVIYWWNDLHLRNIISNIPDYHTWTGTPTILYNNLATYKKIIPVVTMFQNWYITKHKTRKIFKWSNRLTFTQVLAVLAWGFPFKDTHSHAYWNRVSSTPIRNNIARYALPKATMQYASHSTHLIFLTFVILATPTGYFLMKTTL